VIGSGAGESHASEAETETPDYDGEIKGPGPFCSMALMVLRKIRDLPNAQGPGFSRLFNSYRYLSGTSAR
jgi:hypothetical protein